MSDISGDDVAGLVEKAEATVDRLHKAASDRTGFFPEEYDAWLVEAAVTCTSLIAAIRKLSAPAKVREDVQEIIAALREMAHEPEKGWPLMNEAADALTAAHARIGELEDQAHYANSVIDLATKHRDEAEALITALRAALSSSGVINATQAWLDQRDAALASSPPSGTVPSPEEGTAGGLIEADASVTRFFHAWMKLRTGGPVPTLFEAFSAGFFAPTPPSAEAAGVPDGWQLVPKVATDEMVWAWPRTHHGAGHERDIWAAMIDASPSPPSEPTVLPVTRAQVERACAAYLEVSGYRASHTAMEAALNTLMGRKPATTESDDITRMDGPSPGIEGSG